MDHPVENGLHRLRDLLSHGPQLFPDDLKAPGFNVLRTAKKAASPKKTSTAKKAETELTAAEKKLLEAYREASADAKKNALKILKGEDLELPEILKMLKLDSKLEGLGAGDGILGGLKEGLLGGLLGKK